MDNYVVINDRKEVFRNGDLIELEKKCSLVLPKVKIISSEYFLLIDSEKPYQSKKREPNAWIINNKGRVENYFYLGSVRQVITTQNHIVCSYSDSQLGTNCEFGQHGIVVFDTSGNSQFEYYRDEDKSSQLGWIENYAFFKEDNNSIHYMPYSTFAIIEFSLIDNSSKILIDLPKEEELQNNSFWNPKAFSKKDKDWLFITPDIENFNSRIFKMNTRKTIEQIGTCCFSHFPQGLKNGRFFVPFSGGKGNHRKCQFIEI